jgi:shikimate kinase
VHPRHKSDTADQAELCRPLVLVGLMGAGKSSVGRRLAQTLNVPFRDSDQEIEEAAGLSIPEFFEKYGEAEFRAGERRVIARLMSEGPCVLATGGGAFMAEESRALMVGAGVTVWINAEVSTLWDRVRQKDTRPLLRTPDPRGTLQALADARYPTYALADVSVMSEPGQPHEAVVQAILDALKARDETLPADARTFHTIQNSQT